MTLQDMFPARRRTGWSLRAPQPVSRRIAVTLSLLMALALVAALANAPDSPAYSGEDWHGNVAASGHPR